MTDYQRLEDRVPTDREREEVEQVVEAIARCAPPMPYGSKKKLEYPPYNPNEPFVVRLSKPKKTILAESKEVRDVMQS